jgi:hypothetical protein
MPEPHRVDARPRSGKLEVQTVWPSDPAAKARSIERLRASLEGSVVGVEIGAQIWTRIEEADAALTPQDRRRAQMLDLPILTAKQQLRQLDARAARAIVTAPRAQGRAPRSRRVARRTSTSRDGPSDSDPEPPLNVIPLEAFRLELKRALEGVQRP